MTAKRTSGERLFDGFMRSACRRSATLRPLFAESDVSSSPRRLTPLRIRLMPCWRGTLEREPLGQMSVPTLITRKAGLLPVQAGDPGQAASRQRASDCIGAHTLAQGDNDFAAQERLDLDHYRRHRAPCRVGGFRSHHQRHGRPGHAQRHARRPTRSTASAVTTGSTGSGAAIGSTAGPTTTRSTATAPVGTVHRSATAASRAMPAETTSAAAVARTRSTATAATTGSAARGATTACAATAATTASAAGAALTC